MQVNCEHVGFCFHILKEKSGSSSKFELFYSTKISRFWSRVLWCKIPKAQILLRFKEPFNRCIAGTRRFPKDHLDHHHHYRLKGSSTRTSLKYPTLRWREVTLNMGRCRLDTQEGHVTIQGSKRLKKNNSKALNAVVCQKIPRKWPLVSFVFYIIKVCVSCYLYTHKIFQDLWKNEK